MLESSPLETLGSSAVNFRLEDVNGDIVTLEDFDDAEMLLVMFICNHCPFVIHILEGIVEYVNDYSDRGLKAVAISANDPEQYEGDSPDKMKKLHEDYEFPFPYLFDETQQTAKDYDARCTPEFLLFDKERKLFYRGQFDSSRPYTEWDEKFGRERNTSPVTGEDLRNATDALLSGDEPPKPQYQSIGCNIKWKPGNEPS